MSNDFVRSSELIAPCNEMIYRFIAYANLETPGHRTPDDEDDTIYLPQQR